VGFIAEGEGIFFGACFGSSDSWGFWRQVSFFPLLTHPGHTLLLSKQDMIHCGEERDKIKVVFKNRNVDEGVRGNRYKDGSREVLDKESAQKSAEAQKRRIRISKNFSLLFFSALLRFCRPQGFCADIFSMSSFD
jgi:hypothetical protein